MEKILLMPQQAKFFSKRAERKNAFDIIIAFDTEVPFSLAAFDREVNEALELSRLGYLRMSQDPFLADTCVRYETRVLGAGETDPGDLAHTVDRLYLKATAEIDVSEGRFIVGFLGGGRLFLVFNHLVFDLEGVFCFFDEIAHLIKYQPVNCSANPNALVRLIGTKAEALTDAEIAGPWAGKEIRNFMVEIADPKPVESDFTSMDPVLLLTPEQTAGIERNLVSPTNGKNKGVMYVLFGALLWANERVSGDGPLFGHFNHTYSGIPGFNAYTNIITWKVAGVPFVFDYFGPGDERDTRSYLMRIKERLDVFFEEGYKIDIMRQRKSDPELLARLDSPILLFNFRSELVKMEKAAEACGLKMIESGYDNLPRLFPYPARHLFDLNFNKYADGLYLSVEYSAKNYTEAFVRRFIHLFKEAFEVLVGRCGEPVFDRPAGGSAAAGA